MTRLIKNISNQRFGRLVAVKPTELRHNSKVIWLCKCDCGSDVLVVSRSLVTGNTLSCGCLRKEKLQKGITKLDSGMSAFNQLYSNYRRQAIKRGYTFELTRDEFFSLTKQNCYYCNKEPNQIQGGKQLNGFYIYNGIDRLDNSLGYTIYNCVTCCGVCNRAKDVMSKQEFLNWIERVYETNILNKGV